MMCWECIIYSDILKIKNCLMYKYFKRTLMKLYLFIASSSF